MHFALSEFDGRRNVGFELLSLGLCSGTRKAKTDLGGISLLLDTDNSLVRKVRVSMS